MAVAAGLILIVIGIVVATVPSTFVFLRYQRGIDYQESTFDWPSAPGWIIRNDLGMVYVDFEYTYEVDGTWHSSDRLYSRKYYESAEPLLYLSSEKYAELLQKYPAESSISVYYDPLDPSSAALVLSPQAGLIPQYALTALVVAAGEIVAALGVFLVMPRLPGSRTAPASAGCNRTYFDPFRADRSVRRTRFITVTLLAVVSTVHISMALTEEWAWPELFLFAHLVWLVFLAAHLDDLGVRRRGLCSVEARAIARLHSCEEASDRYTLVEGRAIARLHSSEEAPDRYTLEVDGCIFTIPGLVYTEINRQPVPWVTVQYWKTSWIHSIHVGARQLGFVGTHDAGETATSNTS